MQKVLHPAPFLFKICSISIYLCHSCHKNFGLVFVFVHMYVYFSFPLVWSNSLSFWTMLLVLLKEKKNPNISFFHMLDTFQTASSFLLLNPSAQSSSKPASNNLPESGNSLLHPPVIKNNVILNPKAQKKCRAQNVCHNLWFSRHLHEYHSIWGYLASAAEKKRKRKKEAMSYSVSWLLLLPQCGR